MEHSGSLCGMSRRDAVLTRLMGAFFALGSVCFIVGPLTAYASAVGGNADGLTFFIGSILFTLGGACQCLLAVEERPDRPAGLAGWRTAWIQSVGTVLFNVMTFASLSVLITNSSYNTIVWVPNAVGSVCFLVSGVIFYLSSPRRGWLPLREHVGWWEAAVNMLGCVLFGISAVTGYASDGSPLSVSITNWTTTLGAVCFFVVALTACGLGVTLKAPRMRKLREIAREVLEETEHEISGIESRVEHQLERLESAARKRVGEHDSTPGMRAPQAE